MQTVALLTSWRDALQGDHYLTFLRQRKDGAFEEVIKTDVKKNSKDAQWGQLKINLLKLCLGNMNAPIKIQLWDWNAVSDPTFLGEVRLYLPAVAVRADPQPRT